MVRRAMRHWSQGAGISKAPAVLHGKLATRYLVPGGLEDGLAASSSPVLRLYVVEKADSLPG